MLFNSYEFLFFFLPLTLMVYCHLVARRGARAALAWLVLASLVFYGWWNPAYLGLLGASIVANYLFARTLSRRAAVGRRGNRVLLALAIGANLGALAYFKYANFLVDNLNHLLGGDFHLERVILPLAISFFTFQQIAFLVDASRGEVREPGFLRYCLFVTFFPQLIAGPIVHHAEMLPQFHGPRLSGFRHDHLAIGLTVFIIGLFKKVAIADTVAGYSTPVFDAALQGFAPSFLDAWGAALAYTFQLYFDFSGYSDMAVGLAYLFGIRLTLNFFSPYRAASIIEFWRRWHRSLSRFLRDYVYVPLGGNRDGAVRRYRNLLLTMLLGGLWHGAGWTFVAWGALHGLYLVVNHLWRALRARCGDASGGERRWSRGVARALTFVAVVVAWVVFRAESGPAALAVLRGMAGGNGLVLPPAWRDGLDRLAGAGEWLAAQGVEFSGATLIAGGLVPLLYLATLLLWCWFAPNTYEVMGRHSPALAARDVSPAAARVPRARWRPCRAHAVVVLVMLVVVLVRLDATSEFLYFQF